MEKKNEKAFGLAKELPPVGTQLSGKFRARYHYAKVVSDINSPGGRAIDWQGTKYRSMTAAAMAVTKNFVNGWRFWKIVKE